MGKKMIVFRKFDILNTPRDDWNKIHAYRRQYHLEDTPEDPIMLDQAWEENIKGRVINLGMEVYTYGIIDNNKLIGTLFFGYFTEGSPSYVGNEKLVMFEIELLKKYRRNGVGTSALKLIAETCEENGKTILMCNSHVPDTRKFFDAIGAKIAQTQIENRLKFAELNWNMINNWIEEGEEKNPDTKIIIVEGKIPDELIEEFAKVYTESANLQPRDGISMGDMVITVDELRKTEKSDELAGIKQINIITIEKDSSISGFTGLKILPGREKLLSQGLTGVPTRYRGRKLGKWVKAKILSYVNETYPNSEAIITGNAESNEPMLYINNKLGFTKYKELLTIQISLDQLKVYLNSRSTRDIPIE
jgi:RimJ/RimL family protein N-acetyltransferase